MIGMAGYLNKDDFQRDRALEAKEAADLAARVSHEQVQMQLKEAGDRWTLTAKKG